MGYRWVGDDLRITSGPADPGNFEKFRIKSGKTGKFRKIQKIACDIYHIKALGLMVQVDIIKFRNSGKFWKNLENSGAKPEFLSPGGLPPASVLTFHT